MRGGLKGFLSIGAVFALIAGVFSAEPMPRAEWQGLVGSAAQNPQVMRATMGKLSAADQVSFLAEVNAAIAKMPGSSEVKAAAFYSANRAALAGASKANLSAVLAEVFATVPPEYLTDINERFAKDLFNRAGDTTRTYTDEQFAAVAKGAVALIAERCKDVENGDERMTFAVLMFQRASGGTPADLVQTLVAQTPNTAAHAQMIDWAKAALGDGQIASYDPLLGNAQAGEEPNHGVVAQLVGGPQIGMAMLADLHASAETPVTASTMAGGAFSAPKIAGTGPGMAETGTDISLYRVPRAYVESQQAVGGSSEGQNQGKNPYYAGEGSGYRGQK